MKNINWVSSYPKSGNTMMRLFLAAYFFTEDGVIKDLKIANAIRKFNAKSVFDKLKINFDSQYLKHHPYEISKHFLPLQKILFELYPNNKFFFKTHNIYSKEHMSFLTNAHFTQSVIYIVRDPRSVLLSQIHHFNLKSQKESLAYLTGTDRYSIATETSMPEIISSWKQHYIAWRDFIHQENVGMIVKFEDLVNKPAIYFKDVITFLSQIHNFKLDEEKLSNAVNSVGFSNLNKIENKDGFDEKTSKNENFFRKGKTDEWLDELDPKIKSNLENKLQEEMTQLRYL